MLEIPDSSRLELLEKFLVKIFVLPVAESNSSGLLNKGGVPDLHLLRTLSAIWQKSQETRFWEVMSSFVLVAYVSLSASRTPLQ